MTMTMMSSPQNTDGASSAQEDASNDASNDASSSSPSSDDDDNGAHHSHSDATADDNDNETVSDDAHTDDDGDGDDDNDDDNDDDGDGGMDDSENDADKKDTLKSEEEEDVDDDDDELRESRHADEKNDNFHSDDENDDSGSENSEDGQGQQRGRRQQPPDKSSATEEVADEGIELGGPNGSNGISAYALLVGIMDPEISDSRETISIPITRLPITLGKEHITKDPSFIGLKDCSGSSNSNAADIASSNENGPKLSPSMCCIFYRDAYGGRLGLYNKGKKNDNATAATEEKGGETPADPLDGMVYKPFDESEKIPSTSPEDDVLRLPGMDSNASLPTSGFFAIECTGRNLVVGGRIMKKGQVAMLNNGMPIKIASHCFYFLLPKSSSTTTTSSKSTPSIKVKVTMTPQQQIKPEKVSSSSTSSNAAEKRELESSTTGGGGGASIEKDNSSSSLPPPPTKKPRKSEESSSTSFDDKSDAQLLHLLSQKVAHPSWDHEGQKLGSTLATRVCRAAAKSAHIQTIVREEGGVTQREIIDWMNDPDGVYREYERMMLAKIVEKSFMMSMGKAIVRAGYTKNEYLSGRAFRWNLPEDIPLGFLEEGGGRSSPVLGVDDADGGKIAATASAGIKEGDAESESSNQPRQSDGDNEDEDTELSSGDEKVERESIDVVTSSNF
mmetsp:Transcript_14242/g.30418  ORF Transcript_14242/g.30418 Transcript_14242/m.30418 type:complete len:673 (-) Transcript_14242:78-2096(-)